MPVRDEEPATTATASDEPLPPMRPAAAGEPLAGPRVVAHAPATVREHAAPAPRPEVARSVVPAPRSRVRLIQRGSLPCDT